ncbi:MAG: RNA methyltransferase [Thermodesulfovibrionales bacterium]
MNYKKITSLSNQKIKELLDVRKRKGRDKHSAFIIEGPHLIETAFNSGTRLNDVLFSASFLSKENGQQLLSRLSKHTKHIFEVSEHIIERISDTETTQGIIALSSGRSLSLEDLRPGAEALVVVIDGVQDPGNLGTIIRTSDAAAADAVILLPGTCDAFMQKTVRSTAGSIFNIPVIESDLQPLLKWLRVNKIKLAVTSLDADKTIFEERLKGPLALVFGNEAHGVCKEIISAADLLLKVPIYGQAESLNVASAVAVCLYEALRQRRKL